MRCHNRHVQSHILPAAFLWVFLLATGSPAVRAHAAGPDGAAARPPLSPMEQRLTVSVTQKPLAEVIAAVAGQCDVSVTGLEDRSREKITFSAEDEPVETAVKRLLRNLDETNYVFFYSLTQLRQVSVMPRSKGVAQAPLDMPAVEVPQEEGSELSEGQEIQEQAVRVINVNAGTQAEALQLQRGDLVVEYNGVRIENSQQLVSMVKQKSEEDTVEMVVVRDGEPLRMTLKGGMIGINVRTVAVPGPGSESE